MSITSGSRYRPVAEALAGVHAAVDVAADAAVWPLDDGDLESAIEECERAAARLAEFRFRLVAEADGRDLGRRLGASSTAAWLRDRFRIRLGQARAWVEAAGRISAGADIADAPADYTANVSGPPSGREMPATGTALAQGAVSESHAVVISTAMGRLPDALDSAACAEAERQFVEMARQHDPATTATMIDCLLDALTPDALEGDEQSAIGRRELRLSEYSGRLTGRFDPEALAMIRAMLDPLAAPEPAEDGAPDPRTPPRRMADALVEIARRVLSHSDWLPTRHGVRPHLTLISGLNADADPDQDASRPRFGRGEPTWGRPLSAAAVGRIACDAGITWIIADPNGVPLNVGREQRTVTSAQWAALVVRDGGCGFPGCTRSAEWCEAHHILWWRFGGETDLDNLCLLCSYHHRMIHHGGWDIRLGNDRKPEFIPPSWVDSGRTPRRNNRPRYYHNKSPGQPCGS